MLACVLSEAANTCDFWLRNEQGDIWEDLNSVTRIYLSLLPSKTTLRDGLKL